MAGQKISQYGNNPTPVTSDYVIGNKASGPITVTFKLSDLITLFAGSSGNFMKGLFNPYKFSVWRAAAQNAGSAGYSIINWDTKEYDTGSNVDIVTNKGRFTAPVAGFYNFTALADTTTTNSNDIFVLALYKNGSRIAIGQIGRVAGPGTEIAAMVSRTLQLAAGDYVEVYSFGVGTALNVTNSVADNFQGFLLSVS